jgi:hypothetical protein
MAKQYREHGDDVVEHARRGKLRQRRQQQQRVVTRVVRARAQVRRSGRR